MLNTGYCRLCAEMKLYSNLSVIKNEDEFSKNLCCQISQCFQIQITSDDNLPKTICFDCCTQTNVAYEFFQKVHRAQEFLRNVVTNQLMSNNANFQIDFIQPVVHLVTNENNIENIIKTKAEDDGNVDANVFESDALWDNENSEEKHSTISNNIVRNVGNHSFHNENYDDTEVENITIDTDGNVASSKKIKNDIPSNEIKNDNIFSSIKSKRRKKTIIKRTKANKKMICEELKNYTWICNVCSNEFATRSELIEHFRQVHNRSVQYTCVDCSKSFIVYGVFSRHVRRHKNPDTFCCEECGKTYNDIRTLKRHINFVHEHIKLICKICERTFKSTRAFERHQLLHTSKKPEYKFQCDICHKKLKTESDLIEHKKIHDESNKHFTCEICGNRFRVIRNLKEHVDKVHKECSKDNYLQCPLCPTKLKHELQLRRHKREIHSKEKRFECETCGKKYYLLSQYKIHRRLHTGERPFKCQYCEKSFRVKPQLENHTRQHTGEKPYCCVECNHFFTDFANYIKHMRRKHGVTSFKNVKKITDLKSTE